jgi:hypothetical protein
MYLWLIFFFTQSKNVTEKAYLTGLFDHTPEQIVEEEQLYVEIKCLELAFQVYKPTGISQLGF